jgi:hypothetical protein
MESDREKVIEAGVRIGSAAAGGWLSTVLGPEAGPAIAETISEAGIAAVAFLGDRKSERISQTLIDISDEAAKRLAAGETVRSDIADPENDGALALFEAVIEAAAQSVEDRKCAVIANVYASIAFEPSISVSDALLYIERIRACSWRQLVALQFLQAGNRDQERNRIVAAGQEGDIDIAPALSAEFSELGLTLELIGSGIPGGRISNPSTTFGGGQLTTQSVAAMTPTAVGRELIRLGKLEEEVAEDELDMLGRDLANTRPGPN